MIGRTLGPYQIISKLGEGGMGEVYRARDTKLQRDVAIKVLPDQLAHDHDRLARFEREAQVLASLNQPHIAQIYGFEDSTSVKALVMELVEGPTLADRIAVGPISPEETTAIARQIAEALEAAHDRGVVHRDLKPANIKLTRDAQVKVLDFGLAKALDPASSGTDLANSPTLTSPAMTQAGMLLGTAAYMAPEQARGTVVDRRADIWAFGVVVFEMLTGRHLFEGATVSDTLASVLRQDVDWTLLPKATPVSLVALLRRCLERDAKRRLRDIGEARLALDPTPPSIASFTAPATPPPAPPARRTGTSRSLLLIGAAVLLTAGTAGTTRWLGPAAGSVPGVARLSVGLPANTALVLAGHTVIAISRDGSTIALAATEKGQSQLYVRPLKEFEPRPLAGTAGASGPFFSPDGKWMGFFADGKLKKIPTAGGPVITLADSQDNRGGTWADDDTIVYSPLPTSALQRIAASGGTPQAASVLSEQNHERTHRWPALLPDGKTVLVTVGSLEHPDDYDDAMIDAIRLDTGARTTVIKGGRMATYVPTGHVLFLRGKILYAAPFDVSRLQTTGAPIPVIDGVAGDTTTGAGDYAVTTTGAIAYVPGDPSGGQHLLAWIDLKGAVTPIDLPSALYCDPKVAPDGRRIAVSVIESASARNIVVLDPARGTLSKLTFGGMNRTPIWTRDGKSLYYVSYQTGGNVSGIMRLAADGSAAPERIRDIPGQIYLEGDTPNGQALVGSISGAGPTNPSGRARLIGGGGGNAVIMRIPLAGGEPDVLVAGTGDVYNAAISPDGRWVAYVSVETGRQEIFAQALSSSGGRAAISVNGGLEPRWAPDGRTIYYTNGDQMMAVAIDAGGALQPGRPRTLFSGVVPVSIDSAETYHVTPDGQRFLMMRSPDPQNARQDVRTILNWFAELRSR